MRARLASLATNLLLAIVVWLVIAALVMLNFLAWPRTLTGWLLVLAIGPIIYLLAEGVVLGLFMGLEVLPPVQRLSRWVKLRAPVTGISWLRIAVLLGAALTLIGVLALFGFLGHAVLGSDGHL